MKNKADIFFKKLERLGLAVTYDDVLLKSKHSDVLPEEVNFSSLFSKNVPVKCPIISSPMDTVTESKMAIEMAKEGGLGIIHRGLDPETQKKEAERVKFYMNKFLKKPIHVEIEEKVETILNRIADKGYNFRSFPVLDKEGRLVGIITGNDLDFCIDSGKKASEIMTQKPITAKKGTTIREAFKIMHNNKKKLLPLVDEENRLIGMYLFTDVKRIVMGENSKLNVDRNGNLRVGAAVGVGGEALERVEMLAPKNVDVIVIDTAHGDTKSVIETLKAIKKKFPEIDVVAGNVSEGESARRLAKAGADGIRVGQGPGSICTTRKIAGIGCPQATAVYNCYNAIREFAIPICADGGIGFSGHVVLALAIGANTVMLGSMLAGTEEAPGEAIMISGIPYKSYRGMGSIGAMTASQAARERYGQKGSANDKLVPEGVEGIVPFKGNVKQIIFQILGGLRSGMGYVGAANIAELQQRADFRRISGAGQAESHPHGILMTTEPPNYRGAFPLISVPQK
jgi:IMP dehydrogenase